MYGGANNGYKKSYDGLVKKKIPFPEESKYFKPKETTASAQQQEPQRPSAGGSKSKTATSTSGKPAELTSRSSKAQKGGDNAMIVETGRFRCCFYKLKLFV